MDDVESFETAFLKTSYFSGENELDRPLLSLLNLIDMDGSRIEERSGFSVLINTSNLEQRIRKLGDKRLYLYFKKTHVHSGFSYLSFIEKYKLPLDLVTGKYPLKFRNYRLLVHSLKLTQALYLTMKMFKLEDMKVLLRFSKRSKRWQLKSKNLFSILFLNIYSQFKKLNLEEKALIKCLKNSLCTLVSDSMDQDEIPEGSKIEVFPKVLLGQIRKKLSPDDFVRFSFSCLQSKALCQEVPKSFIQAALETHREQLSTPHRGIDNETLEVLRQRGREFGRLVKRYYRPNSGFFPTNKATFAFPQLKGGVKGDLVFHERLQDLPTKEDPDDRMEPFVVGLFGQPGQGKSLKINEIVNLFSTLFPGVRSNELVYQRTCNVEHWDGYNQQPIVILDDLGQSTTGGDIREFQTLVSCCPYVLPMAELDQKGMKFCSPIIICTSNLLYGASLASIYGVNNPIIDDASFWRRFHFPVLCELGSYYCLKEAPSFFRPQNCQIQHKLPDKYSRSLDESRHYRRQYDFHKDGSSNKWKPLTSFNGLLDCFKKRLSFHENFRQYWIQTVFEGVQDTQVLDPLLQHLETFGFTESFDYASGTGTTKCLKFPAYPPSGPLPVRVEPIPEPLKVRVITAGKGDTFCLKPFQRAMWKALGVEPQFCLTHGTNRLESAIERIFAQSGPNDVWISGDYSAATDSFAIEASKALLEGILESIDHEPTRRWAMKEISPHLLVYPPSSGLEPVLQQSGQLMGSLLSFPLLCLLNDCTARFIGLNPSQYLINGDDILMRTEKQNYPLWKEKVRQFGLELSLGKNYVHSRYGTVNSQIIIDGRVAGSGKQKVLNRQKYNIGECLRDLELNMPESDKDFVHDLFKTINRSSLRRTVRNIHVPVSHGGLSFSWGSDFFQSDSITKNTALLVYLNDLFKKIEPLSQCISIPYFSNSEKHKASAEEEERTFNEPVSLKEYHEDFVSVDALSRVRKRVHSNPHLRELFFDQPLENLPSLSFLKSFQIPCTDPKFRKSLQREIDQAFFLKFFQSGLDFGYSSFREQFLKTSMNLPTEDRLSLIVDLMDLNVGPDWLQYLNLDYDPTAFSKSNFEKSLNTKLSPKEFNLPVITDFEDFSLEIEENFSYRNLVLLNSRDGLGVIEEEVIEEISFGETEDFD